MHKKLLEADPTLYDYDGVYDQMQKERIEPKLQEKVARKPKYVEALLAKAQERKIEQDILFERRNVRHFYNVIVIFIHVYASVINATAFLGRSRATCTDLVPSSLHIQPSLQTYNYNH